ncbi:hypothetical protein [Rhizobium ruizarguesonis]|uniref:hypothetical protein n=1 Tax=Rhizobium ruizarguesonis TaxID=2081791 RepID=UPI0013C29CE5|nr:hypothetical protein [Rhizobium ruizarguesonis]NEH32635.1 hypothetical protein [Rhizobium ruizarguesonis]NEK07455.1 hypothetical protein [Rhizobium ruizarguesonis]
MGAQLSFIDLVTIKTVEPPKPPTVWERLAAGLKANEIAPITRADVERAKHERMRSMECELGQCTR